MLISVPELAKIWRLNPMVIVHVGAHEAEELQAYKRASWGQLRTVWIEADTSLAKQLAARLSDQPQQVVVNCAIWDSAGEDALFRIASNSQASSILPMADHAILYPHIVVTENIPVKTRTLQQVLEELGVTRVGLLNLDIQGAEFQAITGLGSLIAGVDAVYSEVNQREMYRGGATFTEINALLESEGFVLVDWRLLKDGWGDALWLRSRFVPATRAIRRQVRRGVTQVRRVYSRLQRTRIRGVLD